ncbi:MAG: hypothetical protein ACPGU6_04835 [Tenacibaculum sp.]
MVYRLKNIEGHNIEDLKNKIDKKTHRFITYPYSISLIIGNINLFSPVYFLESKNTKKHTLKYNLISFFLGWWSIPFGPSNTIKSIKTNTKGGVDVTEDIMLNINNSSLESKKVKIEEIYSFFKHPQKSTEKDFIKSIKKTQSLVSSKEIYIGQYTNTNEFSYTIGFEEISNESKDELMLNLRKYFYKHVNIEIIQIDKENQFDQRLIELGKKIRY